MLFDGTYDKWNCVCNVAQVWKTQSPLSTQILWNIPKCPYKSIALHGLFFSKKDFLAGMVPWKEIFFAENVSKIIKMLPRNSWLLKKF